MNLVFSSRAPKQCRQALEDLMFLNPRQHRVREGIINSLEQFGHPQVEETVEGLSVRVGDHEAQTLFAFERGARGDEPVGVVIFLRTSPTDISIMHVAVHQEYATRGLHAGIGLGVVLVEKVKEIAARIVGVQKIIFFYRREVVMQLGNSKC